MAVKQCRARLYKLSDHPIVDPRSKMGLWRCSIRIFFHDRARFVITFTKPVLFITQLIITIHYPWLGAIPAPPTSLTPFLPT